MQLLEQYRQACQMRQLAARTSAVYLRWIEEFIRPRYVYAYLTSEAIELLAGQTQGDK